MACPRCGCKVYYQYLTDEDPEVQRCAACGNVFHLEDAAPEDDDDWEAA